MLLEIQILAWDRHKNMAELNQLLESQTSQFNNWINKQLNNLQIRFHSKKNPHYHKMNANINKKVYQEYSHTMIITLYSDFLFCSWNILQILHDLINDIYWVIVV